MKIYTGCFLAMIPTLVCAQGKGCATVGASMEISLLDEIQKVLNIDPSSIQKTKTIAEVINISPVTKLYARSLANMDYEADKNKLGKAYIKESDYFSSYYGNHVQTITAKYVYFNNENKKDVFIASSLMNTEECSIRFNGYLVLYREF